MALLAKYYLSFNDNNMTPSTPNVNTWQKQRNYSTYHRPVGSTPPMRRTFSQRHTMAMSRERSSSAPNSPRSRPQKPFWNRNDLAGQNYADNATPSPPIEAQKEALCRQLSDMKPFERQRSGNAEKLPPEPQTPKKFGVFRTSSNTADYMVRKTWPFVMRQQRDNPPETPGRLGTQMDTNHLASPQPAMRGIGSEELARRPLTRLSSLRVKPQYAICVNDQDNNRVGDEERSPSVGSPRHGSPTVGRTLSRRRWASARYSRKDAPVEKGNPEILITLNYSPKLCFVTVTVNQARNLTKSWDVLVRINLFDGMKSMCQKQTSPVSGRAAELEIKQAFMFSIGKDRLSFTHIVVQVFEVDVIGNEKQYADLIIGPQAGGNGSVQWTQMWLHPNLPCSMWHQLSLEDSQV